MTPPRAPRTLILAAAALAAATPAMAEPWACTMSLRCAQFACAPVELRLDVIAADHEGRLFLEGLAGAPPLTRLGPGAYAAHGPDLPGLLLTIAPDGAALLSLHTGAHGDPPDARQTLTYGFCAPI